MIFGFSKMELVEVIDAHAHAGSKWSGAAIMHVISHMIASGRKRWLSIWCCIEQQCMCLGLWERVGYWNSKRNETCKLVRNHHLMSREATMNYIL